MNPRTRATLFWALLGVALVAILAAAASTFLYPDRASDVLLVALLVLAGVLVAEVLLLILGRDQGFDEDGEWTDWEETTEEAVQELVLRCTTCGNTFPVADTGERPLRHTCPHCGRVGVLREQPAAPPGGGGAAGSS